MNTKTVGEQPENIKNNPKIPRQRSSSYPWNTIEKCVALVTKIDKIFTDAVYTPPADISKAIGASGGAFLVYLSSCVQYGLLILKKGEGYKPSPLFKKIKKPLPEENVTDFLKECFQSPEIYKNLIQEFNDKELPSITGLANILDRKYGVKENASERAAKAFLQNAASLKLITSDNILKVDGAISVPVEVLEDNEEIDEKENSGSTKTVYLLNASNVNGGNINTKNKNDETHRRQLPISLKGTREAVLDLPADFTDDDLRRISKYIDWYLT